MADPQLDAIVAAFESAQHDPTARSAAVQDAIAWAFAEADRKRAYEKPLRQGWLQACLVAGLQPSRIDEGQFHYSVRDLAQRPLVAQALNSIPESLPALPRAERFRPVQAQGQPARLRGALLFDGHVSLSVCFAEFLPDGRPDLDSEGRLLPTWNLSWPEEESIWTFGVDWDDFNGWVIDPLEAEPGVVYATANDSGWFQLGLDRPLPADEVLASFLRATLVAYRRAANARSIACP
ncbi:hypothetical protein DER29_6086 [Micromonospora sp. M71_S20]|uniref:hypothetical protein n=1 Tax=Micromonospora sp. M71_S20 TaxID=592872 RepID=UPI000EAD327A|nr:hypothetical protein [Micromonospora sp. M71_S20]RLK09560.1 hypothetical protein DER29_6086 [Micromonospora sp. M71_S20]